MNLSYCVGPRCSLLMHGKIYRIKKCSHFHLSKHFKCLIQPANNKHFKLIDKWWQRNSASQLLNIPREVDDQHCLTFHLIASKGQKRPKQNSPSLLTFLCNCCFWRWSLTFCNFEIIFSIQAFWKNELPGQGCHDSVIWQRTPCQSKLRVLQPHIARSCIMVGHNPSRRKSPPAKNVAKDYWTQWMKLHETLKLLDLTSTSDTTQVCLLLLVWASAEGWTSKGTIHLASHAWRSDHSWSCTSFSSSASPLLELFFGNSGSSTKPAWNSGFKSFTNWMAEQISAIRSWLLAKGTFRSATAKTRISDSLQPQFWAWVLMKTMNAVNGQIN